jgi:hypothetical protein
MGPDRHALDVGARHEILFDLGLGRAAVSFGVRTADRAVLALLRQVAGTPWSEAQHVIGTALAEASPTRVLRTAAARAEVRSAIPPPGATSPDGAHTHLLPALLELDRDLPAGLLLPDGFVPAAVYAGPG